MLSLGCLSVLFPNAALLLRGIPSIILKPGTPVHAKVLENK